MTEPDQKPDQNEPDKNQTADQTRPDNNRPDSDQTVTMYQTRPPRDIDQTDTIPGITPTMATGSFCIRIVLKCFNKHHW